MLYRPNYVLAALLVAGSSLLSACGGGGSGDGSDLAPAATAAQQAPAAIAGTGSDLAPAAATAQPAPAAIAGTGSDLAPAAATAQQVPAAIAGPGSDPAPTAATAQQALAATAGTELVAAAAAGTQSPAASTAASTPVNGARAVSAIPGIGYPFGSHLAPYVAGITPTAATQAAQDELIRKQYDNWKSKIVQARCGGYVVTFNSTYATVSEGAGYGMLLAVQMAGHDGQARDLFDGLLRVVRSHPATGTGYPALMDWRVNADCSAGGGGWNAMDGDLDIAMALLMADKQWGSSGAVNYKAEALRTIAAIKAFNMSPEGYTKGLPSPANNRTSDFMITHFKAFKRATNDAFWDTASDRAFDLLNLLQAKYAPTTGLIPDFVINVATNPAPSTGFIGDGNDKEGFYYWNASRIPWRLAADYVTSGDVRSKAVTTKLIDFFQRTSGGNPALIQAGYKLDGSGGLGNFPSPSFIGPATAGAMVDAKFQPFLNSLWSYSGANLSSSYYDAELQLLSLIVASGNWWTP